MNVTVRYHGIIGDMLRRKIQQVEIPDGATVTDLLAAITGSDEGARTILKQTRAFIDGKQADRAAPLAIYSEGGDSIEITPPLGGYQLDAVAANAPITLPDGTLTVTTSGQERRATGPVKGGGPTITIRASRGEIKLRPR